MDRLVQPVGLRITWRAFRKLRGLRPHPRDSDSVIGDTGLNFNDNRKPQKFPPLRGYSWRESITMSDVKVEGVGGNLESVLEEGTREMGRMQKLDIRSNELDIYAAIWLELENKHSTE